MFARWRLDPDWNQRVIDYEGSQSYFVSTVSDALRAYHVSNNPTGAPLWTNGIEFLRQLPLRERLDHSGSRIADGTWPDDTLPNSEFLPPFVVLYANSYYQYLDRLITSDDDEPRGWSCSLRIGRRGPTIELRVSNGLQQLLAVEDFSGAAATDPEQDPANKQGIDWASCEATLCLKLDRRASYTKTLVTPPATIPKRVLRIHVPNARMDYVIPGTITGLADGSAVRSEGGYLRDDRPQLEEIANRAANWHSRRRVAMELKLKNFREIFQIGWLITDIGPHYNPPTAPLIPLIPGVDLTLQQTPPQNLFPVNAPVTAITYDLQRRMVQVETAYAELDFSGSSGK